MQCSYHNRSFLVNGFALYGTFFVGMLLDCFAAKSFFDLVIRCRFTYTQYQYLTTFQPSPGSDATFMGISLKSSWYDCHMSMPEKRPKIETVRHYLRDLEQIPAIAKVVLDSMKPESTTRIEETIYYGYGELISEFNIYEPSIHDGLVPNVLALKKLLGDHKLPTLEELSAKDLAAGIKVSRGLMLDGQELKHRETDGKAVSPDEITLAIGAPSVDTHPEALAIGTAGHIIERTMIAHLAKAGIDTTGWVKDQILWALEDLALLQHARVETYDGTDAVLYEYFTQAPSVLPEGGMGWRKPEVVRETIDEYRQTEYEQKAILVAALKIVMGKDLDYSILVDVLTRGAGAQPYEQVLGDVFGYLASHVDPRFQEYEVKLLDELTS